MKKKTKTKKSKVISKLVYVGFTEGGIRVAEDMLKRELAIRKKK